MSFDPRKPLLASLVVLVLFVGVTQAQTYPQVQMTEGEVVTGAETIEDSEYRLHRLWRSYRQAKSSGDENAKRIAFQAFLDWKRSFAAEVFEPASYLFLREGNEELRRGQLDAARAEYHHAIDLNPYLWPAYAGLARINFKSGRYQQYVSLELKGLGQSLKLINAPFAFASMQWFFTWLSWLVQGLLCLWVLLLMFKYGRPFYFTTLNVMENRDAKPMYAHLTAAFFLLWPLALGLGIFPTAILYAIVFFPHFLRHERMFTLVILGLAMLSPISDRIRAKVALAQADPLLHAQMGHFAPIDPVSRIQRLSTAGPETAALSQLLTGRIYAAIDQTMEAVDIYERIPQNSPHWAQGQVGKGNIQFEAKEFQEALKTYAQASEADSMLGSAFYNMSLVYGELGDHDQAEQERAKAIGAQPELREKLLIMDSDQTLDASPDFRRHIRQGLAKAGGSVFTVPAFWIPAGALVLAMIAAAMHAGRRNEALIAIACRKCGRIFFPNESPRADWCSQCVNIFQSTSDLPSDVKSRKISEVKRYNRRKGLAQGVLSLVAPGSKMLFQGQTIGAFIALFAWLVLVLAWFKPLTQAPHPSLLYLDAPTLFFYLWALIAGVFWLIFGLRPAFQER